MMPFPSEITQDEVAELPLIRFAGKAHVLSSARAIRSAIQRIEGEPYVGFDTETKPNFRKGQFNKVALVQIATKSEAFLVRLRKGSINDDLISFLENDTLKLGIALHDDIKALQRLRSREMGRNRTLGRRCRSTQSRRGRHSECAWLTTFPT